MKLDDKEMEILNMMFKVYGDRKGVMNAFYIAPMYMALSVLGCIVETYAAMHGTTAPVIFEEMLKVSLEVQEEFQKEDKE